MSNAEEHLRQAVEKTYNSTPTENEKLYVQMEHLLTSKAWGLLDEFSMSEGDRVLSRLLSPHCPTDEVNYLRGFVAGIAFVMDTPRKMMDSVSSEEDKEDVEPSDTVRRIVRTRNVEF